MSIEYAGLNDFSFFTSSNPLVTIEERKKQHILVTSFGLHFPLSEISPAYPQGKEYLTKEWQRDSQEGLPT